MGKMIISEERLNQLIYESMAEVAQEMMLEEGRIGDFGRKVWNGLKTGAQAVGRGISQAVKDPVGTYGSAKGWIDQQRSSMQSRFRDAYNTARDRVRAQTVNRDPWEGISPEEKEVMLKVRGYDDFGNAKFRAIRYAKALSRYGYKIPQIVAIMTEKGFKGITPKYAKQLISVGVPKTKKGAATADNGQGNGTANNGPVNNGELGANPDLAQQGQPAQQKQATAQSYNGGNIGGGAGMDYSVEESVAKIVKECLNELGEKPYGQEMLGRLYKRNMGRARKAQSIGDNDERTKQFKSAVQAYQTAEKSRNEGGNDEKTKQKLSKSFDKGAQAGAGKINEIGDTYKGQEKLGRLSGRRLGQAFDLSNKISKSTDDKEIADLEKKKSDLVKRSTNAYVKARDERDAKGNSWEAHPTQMRSAFNSGQAKEDKKRMKRLKKEKN